MRITDEEFQKVSTERRTIWFVFGKHIDHDGVDIADRDSDVFVDVDEAQAEEIISRHNGSLTTEEWNNA